MYMDLPAVLADVVEIVIKGMIHVTGGSTCKQTCQLCSPTSYDRRPG